MFSKCTHIYIKSIVTDPNTVRLLASQMTGDYSGFKNQIGEAINKQKTDRLMSKFFVCSVFSLLKETNLKGSPG